MLVLTRTPNESILIGDEIEVIILEVRGKYVRVGIKAPDNIAIHRSEVKEQISRENKEFK